MPKRYVFSLCIFPDRLKNFLFNQMVWTMKVKRDILLKIKGE